MPSAWAAGLHEIIDRQHLFNVYVHLPPNRTLSGPPSVFHGRCGFLTPSCPLALVPCSVEHGARLSKLGASSSCPLALVPCSVERGTRSSKFGAVGVKHCRLPAVKGAAPTQAVSMECEGRLQGVQAARTPSTSRGQASEH